MKRYIKHIIASAEKRTDYFLKHQIKDRHSNICGGLRGDIIDVKPTVFAATLAVSVYVNRDSRFYMNEELYDAISQALDFIRRYQREDGSFDYPCCNYKSAPDTSFCFERLIAAYRLLIHFATDDKSQILQEKYLLIMKESLLALKNGGFHTPNHRWAITAALLQGANLFREEAFSSKLLERAKQYLQEGIDGNEDGEYAERSTGNYNGVVNNSLMSLYEESGDESYLGYVERNLHMMLTYIDPDDTIFTQNSTRQDQGRCDYADMYFYQYLYMTALRENSEFDGAAHKIIKDNMERGDVAPDCLHFLMLTPAMMSYEFKEYGFLKTYRNFYADAGILRVKTPMFTYSVLKGKSQFFFFKVGNTQVYVKIGESFCDIRNFIPQEMDVTEGKCILSGVARGWYYQPFEEAPDTNDWWKMDHSKRELLISSEISLKVIFKELNDGMEMQIISQGIDRVPLRVEICIPAGSVLENQHFYLTAEKGADMILRDGMVNMSHSEQTLQIGPGFGRHEFKGHYSGEEKNHTGYTIYCNDYTPYMKTVYFKIV